MSAHHHHGHHHGHLHFSTGLLSADERRQAGQQLILAMLALGLLALGLVWRWLAPSQDGVAQLLLGVASLLVAVPVLRSAWHSLLQPSLHGVTDQLIALAMLGAWATGDLATAALLPIIMILGHVLEERSVLGSQEAIGALGRLTRSQARLIGADGEVREVDNASLKPGDQVEVRAGDRVPADGRVLHGQASLDTAPITGEALPQEVDIGAQVYGGAINLDGLLRVEVTGIGDDSTLGKVIALMQRAEQAKPPITRLLERHAGRYLVLVLLIAAATWFVTGDAQAMLAVLVAACPCALVLSAPATAIAGIAVAARHGILIRGSAFLEELADLSSLVIDKTGTLTHGALHLQRVLPVAPGLAQDEIIRLAASLGTASSHPVSRALASRVPHDQQLVVSELHERQGFGVVARTERGRRRWAARNCSRAWASRSRRCRNTTAPSPGWPWTVASRAGCCWPTTSARRRRKHLNSFANLGWTGSCCSPVTGAVSPRRSPARPGSPAWSPRPCPRTSCATSTRKSTPASGPWWSVTASMIHWRSRPAWSGWRWGRAVPTSPWPRRISC